MALSIAVRPGGEPHGNDADVWQVRGPFSELTTELVRLFAVDHHRDELFEDLGVGREEMAAYRFSTLAEPGGALFVAERAGRLEGLLFLAPEGLQSAVLGRYIWSVRQLAIAPDASEGTAATLLCKALKRLEVPLDCLVARVPSRDREVVCGFGEQGFEAVGSELIGVLPCRARPAKEPLRMKLVPMQKRHLSMAAGFVHLNGGSSVWPSPVWLGVNRLARLYECLLAGYVEEPRAGGLVAESPSGDLLGFITYKKEIWLGEFTPRCLASLDFYGVRPDLRSNGVGNTLHSHALSALAAQSVDAVETRTSVTTPDAAGKLKLLRRLGCRAFTSELTFQRWFNRGECR